MADDAALLHEIAGFLSATGQPALTDTQHDGLARALHCLKERAKTIPQVLEKGHFVLTSRPIDMEDKAAAALDPVSRGILRELTPQLQTANWQRDALEDAVSRVAEAHGAKLGKLAAPLRAALAGRTVSPSVFDMMLVLGREETLSRLQDATE
jgi:glutamyl-tRNA synthetase